MINIEEFYLDVNSIHTKPKMEVELLNTPLLECVEINDERLFFALNEYLMENFENSCNITQGLLKEFDQDSCLQNLMACGFYALGKYKEAEPFFNRACEIIQSYHAVYHFVGYVFYYNRATLNHILGNVDEENKDLSQAQFLYHENNPNRDVPITIDDEKIHFKNPTKDMIDPQNVLTPLSIFKGSDVEGRFWQSLKFFEKRQWNKASDVCLQMIDLINAIHKEYHYSAACMFYNRGMNAMKMQKYDIAISDFSKAITFDLRNPSNNLYRKALQEAKTMVE